MIEDVRIQPNIVKFCRMCEHSYGWHDQNGCHQGVYNSPFGKFCKCKEYITKDNLKYLEWKYEQNKLSL